MNISKILCEIDERKGKESLQIWIEMLALLTLLSMFTLNLGGPSALLK